MAKLEDVQKTDRTTYSGTMRRTGDAPLAYADDIRTSLTENGQNDLQSILTELSSSLDDKADETIVDRLLLVTRDIVLGAKTVPSWGDVNSSGAQGGIASGPHWTLELAKAATFTAPSVPNAAFVVIRVPVGSDPRHYRVVFPGVATGTLNLLTNLGSDANWDYYEEGVNATGLTVTLQSSSHTVGLDTWGGLIGAEGKTDLGIDDLRNRVSPEKLWEHTATAQQWNAGNGVQFPAGLNTKIWNGFKGDSSAAWSRLELELKYTYTTDTPNLDHYGLITFAGHRSGHQTSNHAVRIHGSGFMIGGLLHGVINFGQPSAFNSERGSLHIDNCVWCTTGDEILEATLYGIM